jgi:2-oxoglutarate dehydrogenase complex dehydrogenase (E1) component-like enzyme
LIGHLILIKAGDAEIESRFNQDRFKELAQIAFTPPKDFVLQRQVEKIFTDRLQMADEKIPVNWGFAENMAYATLLDQGYPIRFSGPRHKKRNILSSSCSGIKSKRW